MKRDKRKERARDEQRNAVLVAALTCIGIGAVVATGMGSQSEPASPSAPSGGTQESSGRVAPASVALESCTLPGVSEPARCGSLEVPENPDLPEGRRISIAIAVLPATSGKALADPIVPLPGGPAEDIIGVAAYFVERLAPLRDARDILLVDQRGAGRSSALRCDLYSPVEAAENLRQWFVPASLERCARELRQRADLTQYGYLRFIDDLEGVRQALGYSQLNLFAGSYGTRAAQVYVRAHPKSVRTVLFGSVVPIDEIAPLTMAKAGERARELMFSACDADAACRAAYPNLREEFRQVAARLESGVRVSIAGVGDELPLDRGRVAEWFRSKLYRPSSATILPWAIHRAYGGDWNPIAEDILVGARERDRAYSFGLFFAITCSDDVAFIREDDIAPNVKDTFLGDFRVRQQQAACRYWPRAPLPRGFREPVRSPVPALFVSGDADAAGPLWITDQAARGFSNRAEVVMRNRGHTEWNECVGRLYARFVRDASPRGLDATSCPAESWPPFRTN